jgi:hypothetical protein
MVRFCFCLCAQQAITQREVVEVEYMVSICPGTVKVPLLFGLSVGDVPSVSCFLLSCLQQSPWGVAGGVQKLSHSRLLSDMGLEQLQVNPLAWYALL